MIKADGEKILCITRSSFQVITLKGSGSEASFPERESANVLYNMSATICLAHSCHSGGSPGGRIRHNEKIVSPIGAIDSAAREIADSRDLTKRIDIGGHDKRPYDQRPQRKG